MELPDGVAQRTLDALTLNIAVLDEEGTIIGSNRAWQEFGQFNGVQGSSAMVGQNYVDVTEAANDEYAQRAADGLRTVMSGAQESFHLEYPCHSPTEKRWFLMHVSGFTSEGDVPYFVVAHEDITERKQAEEKVTTRNENLETFASMLSHDIRNPINVAQGNLDLLASDLDDGRVETIRSALDRMTIIVEDALTMIRSQTQALTRETVSLRVVAKEAWESVETKDATLDIAENTDLFTDRGIIGNVFENLFRNAVEHAGSGVTVRVGTLSTGFYVEDDGPGIPPERREDVFEMGVTTNADGTGFGLAIVRQLVTDLGWTIELTDGRAGGARFEITTEPSYTPAASE